MAQARTVIGLDVHATKIVAATLDTESGELGSFHLAGCPIEAARFCAALPAPVRATYEAGPTGYGLARELAAREVECVVAAPGKIPRAAGDRVKTDRRDAEHLARPPLAGKLHPVRVPGTDEEALRDLVRAPEDLRGELMRARGRARAGGLALGDHPGGGLSFRDRQTNRAGDPGSGPRARGSADLL
jgi:transposase